MNKFKGLTVCACKTLDYAAAACIFLIMAITVVNIFLRAGFGLPLQGAVELVCIFSAVGIGLALANSAYNNAQIEVSYFLDKLPKLWQKVIGCCTCFLCLIFWSAVAYFMVLSGQDMARAQITTASMEIPLYPVMYLLAVGLAALSLFLGYKMLSIPGKRT